MSTIDKAVDTNAGNNSNGTKTPEMTPYKIVAAEAVKPATVKAFKKIIGSKNQVKEPKSLLPAEGRAIRNIGDAGYPSILVFRVSNFFLETI
ncbi:hypothetical protein D9M71_776680 [compost metagenome]